MAGSNSILFVKIRTTPDRAVDFNKHVNALTTSRACKPSNDIKGNKANKQPRCEPAHNQCSITLHPLYYNYMTVVPGATLQLKVGKTDAVCTLSRRQMPLSGWSQEVSIFYLFFPRLISAAADWMFTVLPNMVWP